MAGESSKVQCAMCPRFCEIAEGGSGFCRVRANRNGRIVLSTFGKVISPAVDPMEKKPLYHFYPGTPILSLGSIGCNMACDFCQNADISKTGDLSRLTVELPPEKVPELAIEKDCRSVAFTYNEPIVWAEYAVAVAQALHEQGLRTVAVTAGYIAPEKRAWFFGAMDAANVDLKGFREDFYREEIGADLESVKETLRFIAKETDCWLEITTLLIPTRNDSEEEISRMCDWIARALGPETPLHLSAFHPAHRRTDLPRTPPETLFRAREWAFRSGLRHVYTGNIPDPAGQSTYCPQCGQTLIFRNSYSIEEYNIDDEGCCRFCGQSICGRFADGD